MCWWDVVFTCGQAETRAKDQSSEQIVAMVLCSALFASVSVSSYLHFFAVFYNSTH